MVSYLETLLWEPVACASAVVRCGSAATTLSRVARSVRESAAARTAADALARSSSRPGRAGGVGPPPPGGPGEGGGAGRARCAFAEPLEVALGGGPADAEARGAVARQ